MLYIDKVGMFRTKEIRSESGELIMQALYGEDAKNSVKILQAVNEIYSKELEKLHKSDDS